MIQGLERVNEITNQSSDDSDESSEDSEQVQAIHSRGRGDREASLERTLPPVTGTALERARHHRKLGQQKRKSEPPKYKLRSR
jgi:hypothetical protein